MQNSTSININLQIFYRVNNCLIADSMLNLQKLTTYNISTSQMLKYIVQELPLPITTKYQNAFICVEKKYFRLQWKCTTVHLQTVNVQTVAKFVCEFK